MEHRRLIPFPSLRTQLLIITLVVLALPWLGIQNIREMERLLRQQQAQSLITATTTIANELARQPEALLTHQHQLEQTPTGSEIRLFDFEHAIHIDGFADDWPRDLPAQAYDANTNLIKGDKLAPADLSWSLIAGRHQGTLYLLLDVSDNELMQRIRPTTSTHDGDHLLLTIENAQGRLIRFLLGSNAPGWLSTIMLEPASGLVPHVQAELQQRPGGYVIEIALPLSQLGRHLAIAVADQDRDTQQLTLTGNADPAADRPGLLFTPIADMQHTLTRYQGANQRLQVLDTRANLLAQTKRLAPTQALEQNQPARWLQGLYRLLLLADMPVGSPPAETTRVQGEHIAQALSGQPAHRISVTEQGQEVMTVAVPLRLQQQQAGVIVIESSLQDILAIKGSAITNMMITTLLAMAIIGIVLLLYASLFTRRIRLLNRRMRNAVSEDGQVRDKLPRSLLDDEIGQLNRGLADMVEQLQEYQRYLQGMTSRLSHELRTPLTVVQSSLENLQAGTTQDSLLQRAQEGLDRLKMILSRLTEASRLEQALKNTENEDFDLAGVINGCIQGYRQAFPETEFEYRSEIERFQSRGTPELIAQMLDKLISNARDFHTPGTAIRLQLKLQPQGCTLHIDNDGPPLPATATGNLFDSMISYRDGKGEEPHLGLGLYIVKLIAEHHHAVIQAHNTAHGVRFSIRFRNPDQFLH